VPGQGQAGDRADEAGDGDLLRAFGDVGHAPDAIAGT
jgi:hypothetical protein